MSVERRSTTMTAYCDVALRRIEERALNVTASARQLIYDGWLLRLMPGKTKRARSINASLGSSLPLADKISYCEATYAQAGLPTIFRLTPFDRPVGLDAALAARGYVGFDETLVQVATIAPPRDDEPTSTWEVTTPPLSAFATAVAAIRESPRALRDEHEARLRATPVGWRGFVALRDGLPVAAGQLAFEDSAVVGLFDVVTAPAARNAGAATALCRAMLAWAWTRGTATAYLQVTADNHAALALYRKLGFAEGYRYHYRARDGECQ